MLFDVRQFLIQWNTTCCLMCQFLIQWNTTCCLTCQFLIQWNTTCCLACNRSSSNGTHHAVWCVTVPHTVEHNMLFGVQQVIIQWNTTCCLVCDRSSSNGTQHAVWCVTGHHPMEHIMLFGVPVPHTVEHNMLFGVQQVIIQWNTTCCLVCDRSSSNGTHHAVWCVTGHHPMEHIMLFGVLVPHTVEHNMLFGVQQVIIQWNTTCCLVCDRSSSNGTQHAVWCVTGHHPMEHIMLFGVPVPHTVEHNMLFGV